MPDKLVLGARLGLLTHLLPRALPDHAASDRSHFPGVRVQPFSIAHHNDRSPGGRLDRRFSAQIICPVNHGGCGHPVRLAWPCLSDDLDSAERPEHARFQHTLHRLCSLRMARQISILSHIYFGFISGFKVFECHGIGEHKLQTNQRISRDRSR